MKQFGLSICLFFLLSMLCYGEKKPIDATAYGKWRRIDSYKLSEDGNWAIYRYLYIDNDSMNKQSGKCYYLYNNQVDQTETLNNIDSPHFFASGKWLAYQIHNEDKWKFRDLSNGKEYEWFGQQEPDYDTKEPIINYEATNNAGIVFKNIVTGDSVLYAKASYLRQLKEGNIIFIRKEDDAHYLYYSKCFDTKAPCEIFRDTTKTLNYFSLNDTDGRFEIKYNGIIDYYRFVWQVPKTEFVYSTRDMPNELQGNITGIKMLPGNELIEFEYMNKTVSKSNNSNPPKTSRDTTFELELWSWNDRMIPSEQSKSGYRIPRPQPIKYIYNTLTKKYYPLVKEPEATIRYPKCDKPRYAVIYDETPYVCQKDWLYVSRYDNYLVDLYTGKRSMLNKKQIYRADWSPNGDYVIYYDDQQQDWIIVNPSNFNERSLKNEIKYPLFDELHDKPNPASAYGIAAWSENGDKVYIYDRFDIWMVDIKGKQKTRCLTKEKGRKTQTQIRLLNPDYVDLKLKDNENYPVMYREWKTKRNGFGWIYANGKFDKKYDDFCMFHLGGRSEDGQIYLIAKQNFADGRDLWIYNSCKGEAKQISQANPNHNNYQWGSVKLVSWTNYEGKENQGVLYLPFNYDPSKQYPTIVSFYETHTNEMHTYFSPELSSAMLNIPTYLSMGYIIFQPDVYFKVGNPARSSYDAVVSGTRALIKQGIVDSTRIGLQGHSWSGYQVSHLVTQTDLFACVNIGAPITNMVSGYTGLRAGAGVPRMFMYEDWQCRMGSTLWENVEGYIRNSAIYYADRIHTPVLLFHCDQDEAVSFSDGRNLFLALRRLQRPAWLLNYKGEGHFVTTKAAQRDWTKRMQQFFDYYLKHTDKPRWMEEGITIKERGYDQKYDLINDTNHQITKQ